MFYVSGETHASYCLQLIYYNLTMVDCFACPMVWCVSDHALNTTIRISLGEQDSNVPLALMSYFAIHFVFSIAQYTHYTILTIDVYPYFCNLLFL